MKTIATKMKIIFMLSTMFIIFGANAQHREHNPEQAVKKQTEWMKTELSLSDEQVSKVESIHLSYAKKRKEMKEQMHQQMKSMEEEKQKEMGNVLTKEQLTKYEARKVEMKEQRKQSHMKGKEGCKGKKGCDKKKEEK